MYNDQENDRFELVLNMFFTQFSLILKNERKLKNIAWNDYLVCMTNETSVGLGTFFLV